MMKMLIALWVLFWIPFFSAPAEPGAPDGLLWTQNSKTSNGRSYLEGFVRGYIEGKRWGIEMMEATLPHAQFESTAPIDEGQIESKLFMDRAHYARALEEGNLTATIDLVTEWYRDPQNSGIRWVQLVELAIGKVNGFHLTYVTYHLKWLQDRSIHKRIDWFHTIDPATGKGEVKYYDEGGKIVRVELVE